MIYLEDFNYASRNISKKLESNLLQGNVYKDPISTNSLFAGRNLPSFVKDFILKRFINKEDGSVNRLELTNFWI